MTELYVLRAGPRGKAHAYAASMSGGKLLNEVMPLCWRDRADWGRVVSDGEICGNCRRTSRFRASRQMPRE